MTKFVHLEYSRQHLGVERIESAIVAAQHLRHGFSGARGLATLLLSAIAAAVMVVAYQVMENVTEGHLLLVWMALWAVAFAALALFAGTARQLARRVVAALDAWSSRVAQARSDARLWETAQSDPRVMADLQAAMLRHELESEERPVPHPAVVKTDPVLRAYQRHYI